MANVLVTQPGNCYALKHTLRWSPDKPRLPLERRPTTRCDLRSDHRI